MSIAAGPCYILNVFPILHFHSLIQPFPIKHSYIWVAWSQSKTCEIETAPHVELIRKGGAEPASGR